MSNFRGILFAAALLATWETVSRLGLVDRALVPSPLEVASSLRQLVLEGDLLLNLVTTSRRVVISLVLAGVFGIPLGLLFGCNPRLYSWFESVLNAFRSIPATCLFPLLLIVVGVGESSIIVLAMYPCLLIFIANSATGASLTDTSRLRLARALGSSQLAIVRDLVFYEALPHIMGAVRTCVSYSLVLVVAVEMFIGVGKSGLGRAIFDLQSNFKVPETYAAIIVTGALGIVLNIIVNRTESYLLRWLPRLDESSR